MYRPNIQRYVIAIITLAVAGCAKTKPSFSTSGNLVTSQQITSSSTRLVNLYGYTDLAVNGKALTDMLFPSGFGQTIYPVPTPYFPTTGKMGQTYKIPQQFFDAGDTAWVTVLEGMDISSPDTLRHSFRVTDDYSRPNDYYIVPFRPAGTTQSGSSVQEYSDSIFAVPRPVSPAPDPTHILVRLLNISSSPDPANLVGGMRLAYANGQHVASGSADTLVSPGRYSGYIELPYGTYQFKVLTADSAQVPSAEQDVVSNSAGLTLEEATGRTNNSALTYAPIISYQPGGVYTIVVCTNNDFQVPYANSSLPSAENSFWVITDISPAANVTYARMQVANAVPGSTLTVSVDGQAMESALTYPVAGGYQTYVNGSHVIRATDQSGKVVAQQTLTLNGNDNITAWIYPSPSGDDSIFPVQNNLSGSYYNGGITDGSNASTDQLHTYAPYWIRFVNLCPDLPLVTFTQANGDMFADGAGSSGLAAQNLAPGQLPGGTYFYYVAGIPAKIEAYQSQPLILPGDWLSDIPALTASQFVMSTPGSYPYGYPTTGEPGIYTVALVGRHDAGTAQMIIVKHNQ